MCPPRVPTCSAGNQTKNNNNWNQEMDDSRGKVPQLPKKPQDDIISTKRSQYQDQQLETKIGTGRIKQPSFGMRHCGPISTIDYVKSSRVKFRSVGRKRRLQWRIDSLIVELLY